MDANKQVTATFVNSGAAGISHQETVTGSALVSQTVSTGASLSAASADLYLAAISSRSSLVVTSVSGLGLSWTRVLRQCAGRNQTMLDVWMAQGAPTTSGPVSAQFSVAFKSAVIAVSRFSGVHPSQPLGSVVGGNTLGADGVCSGGVDSASYSLPLSAGTPGALVYAAAAMRNRSHSPGSGYSERAEIMAGASGDVSSVVISDGQVPSPGSLAVNGAFSGTVDWAAVGLEIRPPN